jgi:hypothetical protein
MKQLPSARLLAVGATSACAKYWPPLISHGTPARREGATAARVAVGSRLVALRMTPAASVFRRFVPASSSGPQ